jgi:hypothetical protein
MIRLWHRVVLYANIGLSSNILPPSWRFEVSKNVKLPLCLTKHYTMKMYGRIESAWLYKQVTGRVQSQSYFTTDSQSVCPGVEPNLGLLTRDLFLLFIFF